MKQSFILKQAWLKETNAFKSFFQNIKVYTLHLFSALLEILSPQQNDFKG